MKTLLIILIVFTASLTAYGQPKWIVYNTGNSGLPSNSLQSIAIDSNNVKWIGTTDRGLVRFDGLTWLVYDTNNSPFPSNYAFKLLVDTANNLWIGTLSGFSGGVVKFDGINWTIYNPQNSGIPFFGVTDMEFDTKGNLWVATPQGLGKFDGSDWTVYRDTNSGLPVNILMSVATEDSIVWIGTQNSGIVKYDRINWTIYNTGNSGLPSNEISPNCIEIDSIGNKWIGTFASGVTTFNGTTWSIYNTVNSGLPYPFITALTVPSNTERFIGVADRGLAIFTNDTCWNVYNSTNSPIPNANVLGIDKDKLGNIWISTRNGLAVFNPDGVVNITNTNSEIPDDFTLSQNYPNPFNPSTKINYTLRIANYVKLTVYDVTGKIVSTLVEERQSAGRYEYEFSATGGGKGLSSGVYFYTLITEGYSQTKKMLLVK